MDGERERKKEKQDRRKGEKGGKIEGERYVEKNLLLEER